MLKRLNAEHTNYIPFKFHKKNKRNRLYDKYLLDVIILFHIMLYNTYYIIVTYT